MLHVLLEHPCSNSLSNRLLKRKTVSSKIIRWPKTKCILVYDEKMPLWPAGNIIHSALKMYWEKGLQQGNPCHELGVRNFAVHVPFDHYMLTFCLMPLDPFSFYFHDLWCSVHIQTCTHTHTHTKNHWRGPNYSMLIDTFQNISLSCPRTQVTFSLP